MKYTFSLGPVAAVAGSLGAQFVLNRGLPALDYPYDFALLYFVGMACIAAVAFAASHYQLTPLAEEQQRPFMRYLVEGVRSYVSVRTLVLLWAAYFFWYIALSGMSNLSLYTQSAVGRPPKELSGVILALRFGFKAVAGFGLGMIAIRFGIRAPLLTTVSLFGAAAIWAWFAPGYAYLFAFAFMGAGELGGTYFPNYVVAFSPAAAAAVNLSLLHLAKPSTSFGPVLHGALTEWLGFRASFLLGVLSAAVSLLLVFRLPPGPMRRDDAGN